MVKYIYIYIYAERERESTPKSNCCTATDDTSRKLSKLDELDMRDTVGEVGTNS